RTNPAIRAAASATVSIVATQGLSAQLDRGLQVLPIPGTTSFLVLINNTGNNGDQYTAFIDGTHGPVAASLTGPDGAPPRAIPLLVFPALSGGVLVLNTTLMAFGEGVVDVTVRSLSNPAMTASVSARVSATANPGPGAIAATTLALTASTGATTFGQPV